MKRILLFFGLLFLANILIGQTTQKDTVNVKPFEDLTLVTDVSVDTSDQFLMYDISAGLFSYRLSLGELLKKAIDVPNIVGSSQIVNGSILDTDISGSAGIGLNKLATTAAGRLLLTDSGGAGTWVSGTPGYGLTISGTSMLADTSSATGLVSKSRLTNALDDVSATGGIWEQENTTTIASANTTDNYHEGSIGIGDFSATTIGATIHAYDVTNTRLRLSDSAANDTVAQAYVEYYRGYATNKLGQIGYTDNTDLDFHIENHLTGGGIEFRTDNVEKMKIFADGQLILNSYGDTLHTGTAVKYLAVTDDGYVIESDGGGASMTAGAPLTASEGSEGDLKYDDNYIYYKSSAGWRQIASSTVTFTYINVDTMPDLYAWYVADSLALSNGAAVTQWTDESGNARHFAQDTVAKQPVYNTNDLNGHATVSFDGLNDYLFINDLTWTGDSIEVYAVFIPNDSIENPGVMGSASSIFLISIKGTTPKVPGFYTWTTGGAVGALAGSGSVSLSWQVLNGYYDKTESGLLIDGTLIDTTAGTNSISDSSEKHFIGAWKYGAVDDFSLNGKIAEIIIFSTKHSTARRNQVTNYLGAKYGITIN